MSKKFFRFDGRGKQEGTVIKNIPVGVWPFTIAQDGYLRAYYEDHKSEIVAELTQTTDDGNRYSKMYGIDLTKYAIDYRLNRQAVTGYYTNGTSQIQQTLQLTDGYTYTLGCEPCKLWAVGWWIRENTTATDPVTTVLPTENVAGGLGPIKNIDGHLIDYYPYLCAKHLNNLNTIITAEEWEDETGKASKNAHNLAQYFSSNIGGEYDIHYIDSIIYDPKNSQIQYDTNALAPTEQLCYLFTKDYLIFGYALCDTPNTALVGMTFKRPLIVTPTDLTYYGIDDFNTYIIRVVDGLEGNMDARITFGNTTFEAQTTNIKWRGFLCIGGPREELDEVIRL